MMIKKTIINIAVLLVSLVAICALLYFCTGSLEMEPTQEQQEKVRIASAAVFLCCTLINSALIFMKKKYLRR